MNFPKNSMFLISNFNKGYIGTIATLTLLLTVISASLQAEVKAETEPTIPASKGNVERGQMAFAKCRTCHYPEQVVGHNNGPSLWNIFGQVAGKQAGFEYSKALRDTDFVWTPELLDFWLANPETFLPDTQMVFVPPKDAQERADIIAYLMTFKP